MSRRVKRLGEENSALLHQINSQVYTKTEVDANITNIESYLAIGSGNTQWIQCLLEIQVAGAGAMGLHGDSGDGVYYGYTQDVYVMWGIPLPTNKGSKKLYIDKIKIGISDADADDYVDIVNLYGLVHNGTTQSYTEGTNRTVAGEYTYSFAAVDCSSYDRMAITIIVRCTTNSQLDINFVNVEFYYDT